MLNKAQSPTTHEVVIKRKLQVPSGKTSSERHNTKWFTRGNSCNRSYIQNIQAKK